MKKSDFYYELPPELIAQTPLEKRDESRLLLLDKSNDDYSFARFYDIPDFLGRGDLLVLNDSRVIPARLIGERADTGGEVELVLLHENGELWECLVRPGKRCKTGAVLTFGGGILKARVEGIAEGGNRLVRLEHEGIQHF